MSFFISLQHLISDDDDNNSSFAVCREVVCLVNFLYVHKTRKDQDNNIEKKIIIIITSTGITVN